MALVPGLSPNIRLDDPNPQQPQPADGMDIVVEMAGNDETDKPEMDMDGNVLRIEHPDGTISVSLNGEPIEKAGKKTQEGWFANLADEIEDQELSRIVDDLTRGISNDLCCTCNRNAYHCRRRQKGPYSCKRGHGLGPDAHGRNRP